MLNKENIFRELSDAPVWLEEDQHIYIEKINKVRFSSVTTILSLIKNKFDPSIKDNIVKQYKKFIKQLNKLGLSHKDDPKLFNWLIVHYQSYKQFLPQEIRFWNGKSYQKPKTIDQFEDIEDLRVTLLYLKESHTLDRLKTTYLKTSGKPMTADEMQQFWDAITKIANVYGTLVHEICEQYILKKQGFLFTSTLEERIKKGYSDTIQLQKKYWNKKLFKNSNYVFEEYIITKSLSDFKKTIIDAFKALQWDLGYVCVPEKIVNDKDYQISGTADIYSYYSPQYFGIKDHKTNKEFTYKSNFGNKLKAPFSSLDECDFNLYALQLSIYAYIIEKNTGGQLRDMAISYFSRKKLNFTHINIPYRKEEALTLLDLYRSKLYKLEQTLGKKPIFDHVPPEYKNNLYFKVNSLIEEHRMTDFYKGKTKKEISDWFLNYINDYITINKKIDAAN